MNILRDDGAIIYLNGIEVVRSNMPKGIIKNTSFSSETVSKKKEKIFYIYSINKDLLILGENILAVEIHQSKVTSSDLSFDLKLILKRHKKKRHLFI